MALHGTIQVNNETVGVWAATARRDGYSRGDEPNTYDVEVLVQDRQTKQFDKTAVVVEHVYADGALALAAKALSAAAGVRKDNTT